MKRVAAIVAVLSLHASVAPAQTIDQLTPHRVKATALDYKGKHAIKLVEDGEVRNGEAYALVNGTDFHDGAIDVDLAGAPAAGAFATARGYVGIAFRLKNDRFEYIYLRPTNGRVDDQERRNHSTQYSAFPEYDFARLRQESPGKYESYVDLEPGVWTHVRIVVA